MAPEGEDQVEPPPMPWPGDLNPLPIGPATGPVKAPGPSRSPQGDDNESGWGVWLVALIPFIVALAVRASKFGWSPSPVDPSNLAYCLFAVSLAGVTRIVSTGDGRRWMLLVLCCGIIQVALGLALGGTFSSSSPNKSEVSKEEKYLESVMPIRATVTISQRDLTNIRSIIKAVSDDENPPSGTAYIFLIGTGAISSIIVLRYWAPVVKEGG